MIFGCLVGVTHSTGMPLSLNKETLMGGSLRGHICSVTNRTNKGSHNNATLYIIHIVGCIAQWKLKQSPKSWIGPANGIRTLQSTPSKVHPNSMYTNVFAE